MVEFIYHDGEFNFAFMGIVVFTIIAVVLLLRLKALSRKKAVKEQSPLERNDVVAQSKHIKQVELFNGSKSISQVTPHNAYALSSSFDSDRSLAYLTFKAQGETIKTPLFGHGVKNVKLRLGDSPKDTDYFDKLELTQLAKYFGFVLRRDQSSVLRAQYDIHPLSLTVKRHRDQLFFILFSLDDDDIAKEKLFYLFGVFEVEPKARLKEKYRWLR
ncbi:hypothetical protein TDB9533_00451 [Thalassocella blandensis]|nr:hypothetical protein TDB9533_00451 [Thalassocella blandensis]